VIADEPWPTYDESKLKKDTIKMAVSVNGKTRDVLEFDADVTEEDAVKAAKESEKVKPFLDGHEIRKVIFVKGRILNIVVA
jgi:leucyl-tRNA synthetase